VMDLPGVRPPIKQRLNLPKTVGLTLQRRLIIWCLLLKTLRLVMLVPEC
jgi:hypothetical protein